MGKKLAYLRITIRAKKLEKLFQPCKKLARLSGTLPTNNSGKERNKMLKTELAVKTIGQPNIQALSESEQRTFFETLFASYFATVKQSIARSVIL